MVTFSVYSRQPAVLPQSGIPIESINSPSSPEAYEGYKFTNVPKKNLDIINQNLKKLSDSGPKSISIYLTIFALLFPFGLWLINARSLKDENELINNHLKPQSGGPQSDAEDNVIELGINESPKNDEDQEIDDQKKAS